MEAKRGLIVTTVASEADSSTFPKISGIEIAADEPANTATKYVFKINDTWMHYADSVWSDVATQDITASSVMTEGNTKEEVNAVPASAFAAWQGKKVNVAVALQTTDMNAQPSITAIKIKGESGAQQLTDTVNHTAINLADTDVEILDITVDSSVVGAGAVDVQASVCQNGSWSEYKSYKNYVTNPATTASAIKFRSVLSVKTPGTDRATIKAISIKHRTDNVAVFSEGTGVCITKTYNFVNPISRAHLMVKHPIVQDTEITAQIALRKPPTTVTGEVLGTGTGASQTVHLAHTEGLASHNFALYFDGEIVGTEKYSFSPTDGQVTFTAEEGTAVTADYLYGWSAEVFVPMKHDTEYPDKNDNNLVDDQFDYVAGDGDPTGSVGTIKVLLEQKTGTVKNEALGIGTGTKQSFKLAHHAKAETIKVKPDSATWTFKDITDVLTVTAPINEPVTVSYDWAARTNYLESISCIFNE